MSNKKKFGNKKKTNRNKNNKKKRIHLKEIERNNKNSEKLIYDVELGLDMNTLLKNNITIADLETLSIDNPKEEKMESKESFIPLSDFLTPEACKQLLPKDDGLSEVACTVTSDTTHSLPKVKDLMVKKSSSPIKAKKKISPNSSIKTQLKIEPKLKIVKNDSVIEEETLDSSLESTVISFPIENTKLLQTEVERKKFELNKYLEEEEKFKAFDKKLVTLTREKLPQKKKTGFSRLLDKIFV
ncbi:MAG: hypothetical protein ACRDAU_18920 [Clostridium sp.]